MSGASPAAAESIRLAQTFVADVIPPYEVFTVIRSMGLRPLGRPHYRGRFYVVHAVDPRNEEVRVVVDAYAARVVSVRPLGEYSGAPVYRRYESGPPPAPGPRMIETDPRYVPPAPVPRAGAAEPRYGEPETLPDDDDYLDEGPDNSDLDEDDRTGSLPQRYAPRIPPAAAAPATRSAAVTPPRTPLPRPRPEKASNDAAAVAAGTADTPAAASDVKQPAPPAPAAENAKPRESKTETAQSEAKGEAKSGEAASPESAKADTVKTEAPKSGVRIIEIKKPEPRI